MPLLRSKPSGCSPGPLNIKHDNVTYVHAYVEKSAVPIHLEEHLIFMNGYKSVKLPFGSNGKSKTLFEFKKAAQVKDNLVVPLRSGSSTKKAEDKCLFFLTAENKLYKLDPDTGKELDCIYLGDTSTAGDLSFTDLETDSYWNPELMIVSTSNSPFKATVRRFAIFNLYPLRFVAMFDVFKEMNGQKYTAAYLKENLLVLQSGLKAKSVMKLYHFEKVLEMNEKMCSCDKDQDCERGHGLLGSKNHGIQPNFSLDNLPPTLQSIDSALLFDFGGYPFHIIYKTNDDMSIVVKDIQTGNEAAKLMLKEAYNGHDDEALFLQDDLNVVVFDTGNNVEIRSLREDVVHFGNRPKFQSYSLDFTNAHVPSSYNLTSARPRRETHATRNARSYTGDEQVYNVMSVHGCADTFVLAVLCRDTSLPSNENAAVILYDSKTGALIKKIILGFEIEPSIAYNFVYYPDYFGVIENPLAGSSYKLRVYRITRLDAGDAVMH